MTSIIEGARLKNTAYGERDITVTLKGKQWVAILGRIGGHTLSKLGEKEYREGAASLANQLTASA